MRTGLPKSSVAPRRANITTPRCQSRAAAPRPRERSRHPPHHRHTHRRGATALCHNPVRGAQRSVPGLDTPLLSACRRYATTPEPLPDRASGLATPPHITTHIVAERRHSAVTRYAERSAACRDSTRPCCRRAGGTPLLQSRSPTARAVSPSVNPRQRRGHMHRRTCAADAPRAAERTKKILQPRLEDSKV